MNVCRSLLKEIPREGFSRAALARLTDGVTVAHRLDFSRRDLNLSVVAGNARKSLSISGVQDKFGLVFEDGRFCLAESSSKYILKPIPSIDNLLYREDVPANEHLTMQIAGQLFGIDIPANAYLDMSDGEGAYVVRRFDWRDGQKIPQEDFAQLLSRSGETGGSNYKYDCSYEEEAEVIRRHCPSAAVELPKFFRRVVFNYLFGNGDAHLKNFSLYASTDGDYVLSPAYDLLNTSLHIPTESALALELFRDGYLTPSYEALGFYSRVDFEVFAERIGVTKKTAAANLDRLCDGEEAVERMIGRSFMSEAAKEAYLRLYKDRLRALKTIRFGV